MEQQKVKDDLISKFEMKELGQADLILGIKMTQNKYEIKINRYGMENCNTLATLAVPGPHLAKSEENQMKTFHTKT